MLAKITSAARAGKVAAVLAAVAVFAGAVAEQAAARPIKPLCENVPFCGG